MTQNVGKSQISNTDVRTTPLSLTSCRKEPPIDWQQLGAPLEKTTQIRNRSLALRVIVLSLPLIAGSLVFSHKKAGVFRTLSLVPLASLVTGFVFWYLNLADDPEQLITRRKEIPLKIRIIPLKDIQEMYPDPRIFSDQEMDSWLRYFLETQSFEEFMISQNHSLPNLQPTSSAIALIKEKYLRYVKHPGTPSKLDLYPEIFKAFFSQDLEGAHLLAIQNKRVEELALWAPESYGNYFKGFWDKEKIEGLRKLSPERCPLYSWLFTIHVYERGIGIDAIETEYGEALSFFGDSVKNDIFQYVAERDALTTTYDQFIQRNQSTKPTQSKKQSIVVIDRARGIKHIKTQSVKEALYQKFVIHIQKLDLGWVSTNVGFKEDIQAFGPKYTAGLKQEIIRKDWDRFDQWTYRTLRNRVGINQILHQQDQAIIDQLKKKFLALPIADLVKADFKDDREKLNVSNQDIQIELHKKWTSMTLQEILASDRATFIFSISGKPPLCDPSTWSEAAARDVKGLPLKAVIQNYGELLMHDILKREKLDFDAELGKISIEDLSALMDEPVVPKKGGQVASKTKTEEPDVLDKDEKGEHAASKTKAEEPDVLDKDEKGEYTASKTKAEEPDVLDKDETCGSIIAKYKLINLSHPKFVYILVCHIADHALQYIEGNIPNSNGIGKLIADYNLMPQVCRDLIEGYVQKKETEAQTKERNLRNIKDQLARDINKAELDKKQELKELDHKEARLTKVIQEAKAEMSRHQSRYDAFEGTLSGLKDKKQVAEGAFEQVKKAFGDVKKKKEELDEIPLLIQKFQMRCQEIQGNYSTRVDELKAEKLNNKQYLDLKSQIQVDQQELAKLDAHRQLLQDLISQKIALTQKLLIESVKTGSDEPYNEKKEPEAEAVSSATDLNSIPKKISTEEMERELAWREKSLKLPDNNIEMVTARLSSLRSKIIDDKKELEKLAEIDFKDKSLIRLSKENDELNRKINECEERQRVLGPICANFKSLEKELNEKKAEKEAISSELDSKRSEGKSHIQKDYNEAKERHDKAQEELQDIIRNKAREKIANACQGKVTALESNASSLKKGEETRSRLALELIKQGTKQALIELKKHQPN